MSNGKVFTKFDASCGYWQIPVDADSSKLLTFNTPFGRHHFKRMPYELHSASEVSQGTISNILCGTKNAGNSQDDIIVWRKDVHSHNETFRNVFEKIRTHGLKLNKSKCQTAVNKLVFLRHLISRDGIKADPKKIHAISNLPQPTNKTELQKFFGMLNYLERFIPNLSIKSANLRKLLEKDKEFVFDPPQIDAFNKLEQLVANM